MLRLPAGIGFFVSSYFPWHTHLKVHSPSEHITELPGAVQFPGRKRVDVLCSAQGHFTLSSHWRHLSKHWLTLAEIKLPNLESCYKLGWSLIAKEQEVKLMNKSVSLKLSPLTHLGNRSCAPCIQRVECLPDKRLGFDDDGGGGDDEFCASLSSSIYPPPLCLTSRHRT